MRGKTLVFLILAALTFISNNMSGQQAKSFKRGLGYNIPYAEDLQTLSKGMSWYYNWGTAPGINTANAFDQDLEFIPMCWNGVNAEALKSFYSSHPEVKYILGFNEPNFKQQANLTPTQAAAKWPLIESIASLYNLKIVGPAMNYAPTNGAVSENGVTYTNPIQYLDDFFKACPNCKVDYIAVHNYMNSPSAVQGNIAQYKKYGKPIWLTEFCQYDGAQTLTPDTQKDYMVELINYLENDPDIYRYAWFIGRNGGGEAAFPYNSLLTLNDKGVATEQGDIYLNMSSFDKDFYFTDKDTIQAEKFMNAHSISLRRLDTSSGNLFLNNFYFKDWAHYQVDLPENKEYTLTFRMACPDETLIQVLDTLGNLLASQVFSSTGGLKNWDYRSLKVTLPAGKQMIQIKSMGEGCNVDWFTFKNLDTALKGVGALQQISVFPNPIGDVVNVDSQENTKRIQIVNLIGKVMYEGTSEKQINTCNLEKGIYLVQFTFENGMKQSIKIIK